MSMACHMEMVCQKSSCHLSFDQMIAEVKGKKYQEYSKEIVIWFSVF